MANLSQERRTRMLAFLDKLRVQNQDDVEQVRAINEIERALNEKKYGLVWEEHTERVDEMLEDHIPVLEEVEERKIVANEDEGYNFLIEGDNLHSLKLLEKTHRGKIDVIYIDPPYNTKNKEFIYNDCMIGEDDAYRHSKWLSFMEKRLRMCVSLLSSEGTIFISIDDNEQAQLKLLCDGIFGESKFVGVFTWVRKKKGSFLNKKIRKMTEYVLCYSNSNSDFKFFGEVAYSNKFQPIVKRTNKENILRFPANSVTTKLKDGIYQAGKYVEGNTGVTFLNDFEVKDGIILTVLDTKARYVWGQEFLDNELLQGTRVELSSKYGFNVLRHNQDEKYKTPSSLINSEVGVGTNEDASQELSNILNVALEDSFTNPKPITLIQFLINMTKELGNRISVLDFFAGSGTTGHAVAALNKEDGGNRKYILCTNNENNICEEVTYKRLQNIQGELPHNLKYLRTDFVQKFSEDEEEPLGNMLVQYIKPLIELEHACDLENSQYRLILDEEEFDEFVAEGNIPEGGKLFIADDIFVSSAQQVALDQKQCDLVRIPEYYYREELVEAGEL